MDKNLYTFLWMIVGVHQEGDYSHHGSGGTIGRFIHWLTGWLLGIFGFFGKRLYSYKWIHCYQFVDLGKERQPDLVWYSLYLFISLVLPPSSFLYIPFFPFPHTFYHLYIARPVFFIIYYYHSNKTNFFFTCPIKLPFISYYFCSIKRIRPIFIRIYPLNRIKLTRMIFFPCTNSLPS